MDGDFANNLLLILGPGLFEDLALSKDELDDESRLEEWVKSFLVPDYCNLSAAEKAAGLAAILEMGERPKENIERFWYSISPPFGYPPSINPFLLIHRVLTAV